MLQNEEGFGAIAAALTMIAYLKIVECFFFFLCVMCD